MNLKRRSLLAGSIASILFGLFLVLASYPSGYELVSPSSEDSSTDWISWAEATLLIMIQLSLAFSAGALIFGVIPHFVSRAFESSSRPATLFARTLIFLAALLALYGIYGALNSTLS